MSDIEYTILSHAQRYRELSNTLSELGGIAQRQRDQVNLVNDLENQLKEGRRRIARLAIGTKKGRREHEDLRDSKTRRLVNRFIGKEEERKAREEDYVAAFEGEVKERENQDARIKLLAEAKPLVLELNEKLARHNSARRELLALYAMVFDGPTEAYPEEDRLEYDLIAAIKRQETLQAKVKTGVETAETLSQALRAMTNCAGNLNMAYDSVIDRNTLRSAHANAGSAEHHIKRACIMSSEILHIPKVSIARGWDSSIIGNADKIQEIKDEVAEAVKRIKREYDACTRRVETLRNELYQTTPLIQQQKAALETIRHDIFEDHLSSNPILPPEYDAAAGTFV